MSVGGKVLSAIFCWLIIGKIWKIKSNYDENWLLAAFFKLKISVFRKKMSKFSKIKTKSQKWENI